MKKGLVLFLFVFFMIGSTTIVHADMGPKPQLKITVVNAPDELYYLDLLVKAEEIGPNGEYLEGLDPAMFANLKSLEDEGWYPALTDGTQIRMFGELTGTLVNGKIVHDFGYHLPDDYRIIMVTQSGKITVSDPLTMDSFYTSLKFDAETGKVTKPNVIVLYATQFATTLIPTLIVEFGILLMFGLYSKRNLIVFLIMNVVTQFFLAFTVNAALITMGLLSAILVLIFVEGFIWIFEMIVCWKAFDKQKKTGRRVAFALVANMVSFILGFILIFVQSTWI
jgi:hypothetical protein